MVSKGTKDTKIEPKGSSKVGRETIYDALTDIYKLQHRISSDSYQSKDKHGDTLKQKTMVKLCSGRQVDIEYTKFTRASDICDSIAESIGLQSSLDFKLFLVNEKNEERVIDDCEFIFKLLNTDFNLQASDRGSKRFIFTKN